MSKSVYFMRPVGRVGPIKIGCSKEPLHRLRQTEIWSPLKLELIAIAPGDHCHEHALHMMFAGQRRHGEWFSPSSALNDIIQTVLQTGCLPSLELQKGIDARVRNKGKMPRRNNASRLCKYKISKRVRAAEQRVHGFMESGYRRPAEVDKIIRDYQGWASPLPTEEAVVLIDRYVAKLNQLPAVDRSFNAWLDWARAAAA